MIKTVEAKRVVKEQPVKTSKNQIKDNTKSSTPVALKKESSNNNTQPINTINNSANPNRALSFLKNVDNGRLYNVIRAIIAKQSANQNVKKYGNYVIRLFNLPKVQLPNKTITVTYGNDSATVNEEYFVKTLDEVAILMADFLTEYAFNDNAKRYSSVLVSMHNSFSLMREDFVALANAQKDPTVKGELEKFVNVVDAYLKSWDEFMSEYPDPDKLKEEVVKMADATATQTGGQAGSIFSNLLDAVYGILGSIVDALKNYATEIAEVLVAGMLGYSVIRYGRQMINGLVNMVSTLF